MSKKKRDLAKGRMREDAYRYVESEIAKHVNRYTDDATRSYKLGVLMAARADIVDGVLDGLARNWRISERARGETTL